MRLLPRPDRRRKPIRGPQPRGVALVAVLLLVAGLIAIATAVMTLSVGQQRAAQRAFEADARREVLDGALRVALAEIAFGKPEGPFWHPRQLRTVNVAGKHVEVTLERESGRIDLNTADEKYLVAALVSSGMTEEGARAGAARIRDWIDSDDKPSPHGGAERDEYHSAKVPYGPRNAPMETVAEVRQVLGLNNLTDTSLDAFTVYSQQPEPAPSEAPQAVRDSLAWLARAAGSGGLDVVPTASPGNSSDPVSYAGSVVRLTACFKETDEVVCRRTVQRITGNAARPFLVLFWK